VQQDYIRRQIDQLGRVLGKVLADLLGLKGQGKLTDGVEITDQILKTELDLDLQKLINIPNDNFINVLKEDKGFNNGHLDTLAQVLYLLADTKDDSNRRAVYEKCLLIYEYLETEEHVYSFERQSRIERIKGMR
jgi:hypothetical protein